MMHDAKCRLLSRRWGQAWKNALPLLGLVLLLGWWGVEAAPSYDWQWRRALRTLAYWQQGQWHVGPLVQGLEVTLRIVGVSLGLAVLLGLVTAILRRSPLYVAQGCAAVYVALVRNTPLLIQLFAMYFVLAPLWGLSAFWAAVWALAAFEGAYMAEIFRAGIDGLPATQWDAAASLGMPASMTFALVILPQAVRRVLPPLSGQAVSLVKDSALVSAIALPDVTMRAQAAIADTFLSLEIWSLVAGIYLLLTLLVSLPVRYAERRYAWRWM